MRAFVWIWALVISPQAFGWGGYGHQQVNRAAALIAKEKAPTDSRIRRWARCLDSNISFLQRLAVTPDREWKIVPYDRTIFYTLKTVESLRKDAKDEKARARMKAFAEGEKKKPKSEYSKTLLSRLSASPADPDLLAQLEARILELKSASDVSVLREELSRTHDMSDLEEDLHFFEADAFIADPKEETILGLPQNPEYASVFPGYAKLLQENQAAVDRMNPKKKLKDPKKPTVREVSHHGTAPWRVKQLYDRAVHALKEERGEDALVALGTLGHYVGDLSQPFHVTLNYDGAGIDKRATGIHQSFEADLLEDAAEEGGAKLDAKTRYWDSFESSEAEVLANARAETAASEPLAPADDYFADVFRLAAASYAMQEPLTRKFAEARPEVDPEKAEAPREVPEGFKTGTVKGVLVRGKEPTVMELARAQMARSAVLTARIWLQACREAKTSCSCPDAPEFDAKKLVEGFPKPEYIPADAGSE